MIKIETIIIDKLEINICLILISFALILIVLISNSKFCVVETDKPIIAPPKIQPQIAIPILSIDTNDCAWNVVHPEKIDMA